jgi:multicomponent K+:H+ antiporter subunit D
VLLERWRPGWQAPVSLGATLALAVIVLRLGGQAATGAVSTYLLGNWPAPFGIALAVDRLTVLMLALTACVALACIVAALDGAAARGPHFHALFQFQLMGLNGAFLTADLFNLFVFFEVLLIASYGLLLHGRGGARLRAGVHYVVFNVTGAALFLIAVSLLYAVTGTLNLADLAVKIPAVPPADAPLVRAAAALLLVVFGIKAALLPLSFWLPPAYSAATAPVAALFAIMTKVGVYAIVRVSTLAFGAGAPEAIATPWLVPLALGTIAFAALGALAARRLRELVAYLVLGSAGTMVAAVGLFSAASLAAALFYLAHSTLIGAALFLLAGLIARQRGELADRLESGPRCAQAALLGSAFFVAAVTVVGLPPLSGFVGKLLILHGALATPWRAALWAVILAAALLGLVALARAGSQLFWKTLEGDERTPRAGGRALAPIWALLGACVVLTALAGPLHGYTRATAEQLLARQAYIDRVLGATPVTRGPGEGR